MEDPGVADCLRFLRKFEHLALQYELSPSEITALAEGKEGAIIRSEPVGPEHMTKP